MQRRVLRYSVVNFALAGRQNLNPLTLGVGDEIKTHARILANNATHLFMKLVGGVKVVHDEGDMGVFATILVGLNAPTGSQVSSISKGTPSLPMNVLVHEPSSGPISRSSKSPRRPLNLKRSRPAKPPIAAQWHVLASLSKKAIVCKSGRTPA